VKNLSVFNVVRFFAFCILALFKSTFGGENTLLTQLIERKNIFKKIEKSC